jgi:hypothetical protein
MRLPIEIIEKIRGSSGFKERHIIACLCKRFRHRHWPPARLPPPPEFDYLMKLPRVGCFDDYDTRAITKEQAEVVLEVHSSRRQQPLQHLLALRLDYLPWDYLTPYRRKQIALRRTLLRDGTLKEEVRVTALNLAADAQWKGRLLYWYQRGRATWCRFGNSRFF